LSPLLALALATATPAAAHAADEAIDFSCNIQHNRGNDLTYHFVEALSDETAVAEHDFTKNGQKIVNPTNSAPYWSWVIKGDVFAVWSRVDQGWSIAWYLKPNPNAGGATLFHNQTQVGAGVCGRNRPPQYEANVPPNASRDDQWPTSNTIPYVPVGGGMFVVAMAGLQPLDMLVDTGATGCSVNQDDADRLVRAGKATYGSGTVDAELADHRVVRERTLWVKSLKVSAILGRDDILFAVSPSGSTNLLCLAVLNALGKMTIDSETHHLTFN
jgi:hypothetical protein